MKTIMEKIISETQGGFIASRKIMDNIIIVQEAIHSSLERKQQGMAIKLDMENAFNRVNHVFLFEIMLKMGFSKKKFRWIKACISSPWIAPLVNGKPIGFFQASRGLRQGCPLSPFLYLIVAESFSRKLQDMQTNRELRGLKIARGVKNANHSQFADDTILLGGPSVIIAERFRKVISTSFKASMGK